MNPFQWNGINNNFIIRSLYDLLESLNLHSSPIIEDKVKKNFKKHPIINSNSDIISDVYDKFSDSKSESEADNISDDDSKPTSSKNAENYKRKDVRHDYSKDNVIEFKLGKYFESIHDSVDINDTSESRNSEQKLVNDKKNLSEKEKINTNRQNKELSIKDLTHSDIDSDTD
ncbi:hypothetical protein M0804_013794 [Polistes exclamans]|nr:hypothetical protein M0804_013794 [Polistes exclamans]